MTHETTPAASRKKKLPLWAWIIGGILVLLALSLVALRWAAASEIGRNFAEQQLESRVVSGQSIAVDGLSGDLLDRITLERLTVSDAEGVWLTASDVELAWSPMSLIGSKLDLELISASEIDVLRRPILPESEEDDQDSGGMPLKGISLSELAIGRFALSEGVVPQAVAGSVNGDFVWTPDRGDLNLQIEPEAEGGDRLVGELNWSSTSPLRGALELNGPAGGLFATLLQLDEDQSVLAEFVAEGEAQSVNASLKARVDETDWIEFSLSPSDELHSFEGEVSLREHPLTSELVARLGPNIELAGDLNLDDPIGSLATVIRSDSVSLNVSDIELGEEQNAARIVLSSEVPDRLIGSDAVSVQRFRTVGDVTLIDGIIVYSGDVVAERVLAESARIGRVTGPVLARYGENKIEVQPDLRAENLTLSFREDPAKLNWLSLKSEVSFDLDTSRLSISSADISTAKSFLKANGNTTIEGNLPADVKGNLRLNLAEFGLYQSGVIQGRWAAVRRGGQQSEFSADLRATGLADTETLSDWLGDTVSLKMNGRVTDEGEAKIPQFQLVTAAGNLTGRVDRSTLGVLNLDAAFLTGDSYPLVDLLPGAKLAVQAKGQPDDLSLTVAFDALMAHLGGVDVSSPNVRFDGGLKGTDLAGRVNLNGSVEDDPITLSSDISLASADWSVSDLQGQWQGLSLTGLASGSGGDLEAITGDMRLVGDLPADLPARRVDLTLHRRPGDLAINGQLKDIETGPLQSSDLDFSVSGNIDEADYDFVLSGDLFLADILQEMELNLSGKAYKLLEDDRNTSGQLSLNWGEERVQTLEPFHVTQSPRGIEGQIQLSLLEGELALELSDRPEERLNLTASGLRLTRTLQALGRAPLEGDANIALNLWENGANLEGRISGQLNDLALPGKDMDPVSFILDGVLQDEVLNLNLVTPAAQILAANVNIMFPVASTSDPLFIAPSDREAGLVTAQLDGRIDNILALILPDQMLVTGAIDADFQAALPFEPQGLTGRLMVNDGKFEHGELGAVFQDINIGLDIQNEVLSLSEFSAKGRKGGTLIGSGALGLSDMAASNINLRANRLVVADRREGSAVASGTIGLEVVDQTFMVVGDLTLDEGQIYLDRLQSSTGVTTLDVRFVDDLSEDTGDVDSEAPVVQIDIALKAPRRLKINGSGMDAELSLDTKIQGSPDDISISGQANIVRGRFDLLGKRFDFVDSAIRFSGDPMDAQLDIEATRDAGDFTAKVEIGGTPQRPTVTLGAEPELPEDEVLSRVLFGRSPSQLTGLEAARLAAALAQLGGGGGFDLMGGIEQLAGLDTLDVSQNESGQITVATGRYLSENVYLEVKSNTIGSPGVSVEWEPRDNISVGAETVPGEGQNFSVQWKKDFD